jgi:hypothetical protein
MKIVIKKLTITSHKRQRRIEWYWVLMLNDTVICKCGKIKKRRWPYTGYYSRKTSAIESAKRFKSILKPEVAITDTKGDIK